MTAITYSELMHLSPARIVKAVRRWWLQRVENHYLISAAVESTRVKEAHLNVAHYQKQAALARSARNSL